MASVTSLDQDMRKLRLDRYTPKAANEARTWIEETLGESMPGGDLLEGLKDGTILCRLANLCLPGAPIKFKRSNMPFIQMENISHFLRACESPPLNMPAHDRFLTVDLYESKDPAQVLQCLGAFSRVANQLYPNKFRTTIGPKRGGAISPTRTGDAGAFGGNRSRGTSSASPMGNSFGGGAASRTLSPALTGGSNSSRATDNARSPPASTSSWSKRADEGTTAPAWNIHQYGYMGGASQGNQGIAFGARRQITTAAPHVPSLAEKERKRREKEAEESRLQQLAEEAEHKRRVEREAEEERARIEEERRWEAEAKRQREDEKRRVEEQKRQWEEEERKWKLEEESRLREQKSSHGIEAEMNRKRAGSDARLQGQFLSQYQAEQKTKSRQSSYNDPERQRERDRMADLERQLEEAKERERQYQMERDRHHRELEDHAHGRRNQSRPRSRSRPRAQPEPTQPRPASPQESSVSWIGDEREYLRQQWSDHQRGAPGRPLPEPTSTPPASRPLPEPTAPSLPSRPLPEPSAPSLPSRPLPEPTKAVPSPRPLPSPAAYRSDPIKSPPPATTPASNRTDRFLSSNPAPVSAKPRTYQPAEMGFTPASERAAEDARRVQSQQKTKAGGWASKSLLEREMERERERQREWEEAQKGTAAASRDADEGANPGQSWDVNQYGYVGGDSQNRGSGAGSGIAFGGRRQIIGPREMGGGGR